MLGLGGFLFTFPLSLSCTVAPPIALEAGNEYVSYITYSLSMAKSYLSNQTNGSNKLHLSIFNFSFDRSQKQITKHFKKFQHSRSLFS
jgi:hypothetical protein